MHKILKKGSTIFLIVLLFSITPSLLAQNFELKLNPAVTFYSESNTNRATGHIHIIAAMADFQRDENPYTSGDGSFHLDYLDRDDIIIGPLPHDKPYFEAHLEFARNYFETVSNQQLTISYEVLPQIYTLDEEMAAYAPIGEDGSENFRLANLARDVWEKAYEAGDLSFNGLDPERTMFVVFHAGAGRDIELTGTTLNKTPQDIPSVFLSESSLQRLLDEPTFDGFPTNTPNFTIRNTAILPQTQSRAGENILGDEFVLELSINGILAANIGSFIGLPDLFNTETGQAGIGRFGLMDGASIFSYLGMFPPELSAWEKYHLGWVTPFDIALDESQIELPAVSVQRPNQIARHFISESEYILIENRHRDPDGTGVTLTIREPDGTLTEVTIPSSDERFNPFNSAEYDEILPPGVVINVSNFDFSLPGGNIGAIEDVDEDRILNGGILIWHIDDAVIQSTIADNRINANTERRGVRLVEADGAQQIGRAEFGLESSRYINGHAFDFWWDGNDFTVIASNNQEIVAYQNRFGPDTQPSNESNSGAPAYYELYDFSANLPIAYVYARQVLPEIAVPVEFSQNTLPETPILSPSSAFPLSVTHHISGSDTLLVIPSISGLHILPKNNQQSGVHHISGISSSMPFSDAKLISSHFDAGNHIFRKITAEINALDELEVSIDWENDDLSINSETLPAFFSLLNQDTFEIDFSDFLLDSNSGQTLAPRNQQKQRTATLSGVYNYLENDVLLSSDGELNYVLTSSERNSERIYAGLINTTANSASTYLLTDSRLSFFFTTISSEPVHIHDGSKISWPAMVDYNQNGFIDFLFADFEQNTLVAKNQNGAILDGFPLQMPDDWKIISSPLLADITGNDQLEIILTVSDGLSLLHLAYDRNFRLIDNFPLLIGGVPGQDFELVHSAFVGNTLISVSPGGSLRGWKFPNMQETAWTSIYGDFNNNKVSSSLLLSTRAEPDFRLLNSRETYNWPNPASDVTHIRFETSEPADITVTIITMNGTRVAEYTARSSGNQPDEIQVQTSNWSSGVYYARVQAKGGNRTESELLKIVVIQ